MSLQKFFSTIFLCSEKQFIIIPAIAMLILSIIPLASKTSLF